MQGELSRRRALKLAGSAGATVGLAGCSLLGGDGSDATAPTEPLDEATAKELAARFAPTVYFDVAERWYPTDPRPYTIDRDGETVVEGFAALDGYHAKLAEQGGPPDPTVFYNGRKYVDSPLAVVQFWFYSAFDQFATNFHWHDWELLQVFVDLESRESQLLVASAHSRKVPNNEFLDPAIDRPRVLPELGSHSGAVSVNDVADHFLRLPAGDRIADVTNRAIGVLETLANIPAAYGLPRDEGAALPYLVPELEGAPIHEHPDLPNVERADLVPEELTVHSLTGLASPPTDLPKRSTGTTFAHAEAGADADVTYDLVPTADLESIADFVGPQLSFEFAVPGFVEDAIASHITATGTPWKQLRYTAPATDITEPAHRAALADRYDAISAGGVGDRIVAGLQEAVPNPDAPDGEGLTTATVGVEGFVLLESEPVAAPTFAGAAVLQDVPPGDHRLTVNVAGTAPHSERLRVGEGGATATAASDGHTATTVAGADGRLAVVATESAVKLRVDTEGTDDDIRKVAVDDDFAGRLYASRVDGPDAVYVHAGGAYTTEVRDADGVPGAVRVNPDPAADEPVTIDRPDTGTASLAGFVAEVSTETRDRVAVAVDLDLDSVLSGDDGPGGGPTPTERGGGSIDTSVEGLVRALDAVATAAGRAAEAAAAGDAVAADRRLETAAETLDRAGETLASVRGNLPDPIAAAVDHRLEAAVLRTDQALAVEKL